VIHTRRTRPRGFTLIELMVALLVSSLLVGMILAIFSRISLAYRGQQQIAGLQQVLAAARTTVELDAKQAGLGMPQGFKTAMTGATPQSPIQVTNSSTNPDQIAFFYADTSTQAVITNTAWPGPPPAAIIDPPGAFAVGDLVVLATASTSQAPLNPGTDPDVATYDSCVLRVSAVAGATITFDTAAPWGAVPMTHCSTPVANRTMVYRFVANAYRINVTTPVAAAFGALEQSQVGGLLGGNADKWTPLAYGFADIQTAVRVYDPAGTELDGDGDPLRNWYSGANQNAATRLPTVPAGSLPVQMMITLVARTDRDVEGIATAATPELTGAASGAPLNNNSLGDRPSTVLPVAQPWPDPLLPGNKIYRYTTFQVDFRNLGVGTQP
jgi:prepilin-type N-terminal cleavage/methylation domain-containing protein